MTTETPPTAEELRQAERVRQLALEDHAVDEVVVPGDAGDADETDDDEDPDPTPAVEDDDGEA